ncbi:MAG TPA: hypothetical protein ENN99_00955 [Chloroflexi bacterium]|nr:hypothetical protein [Chloroflexota bacterium]
MVKKKRRRKRPHGKRFRLLIYEQMWRRWALPLILIVPASIALWWSAPHLLITNDLYRALALVPAVAAVAILLLAYLSRRRAWVQCRHDHIRIQSPTFPLIISYSRVKEVKPGSFADIFDPAKEKAARRNWLGPYWGKTALVMQISKYPITKFWLRLWFSPYVLLPDAAGFVFLVEDWMALSRQIDDYRTAWETRRAKLRQRKLERQAW